MKRFQLAFLVGALCLVGYVGWAASVLFPPILVGIVLAYVFRPLKAKFHFPWLPHEAGVMLAFGFILVASTVLFFKVKSFFPSEKEKIELKIRLDYKLHQKFTEVFENTQNSFLSTIGKEISPAFASVSSLLELTPYEQDKLEKFRLSGLKKRKRVSDLYYGYHVENQRRRNVAEIYREPSAVLKFDENGEMMAVEAPPVIGMEKSKEAKVSSSQVLYHLSLWMLCPLVFIFLIFDNGQIRRFVVSLVPNSYFEVTLTLIDRLDEALGLYLRGTAMECFLVALCTFIGTMIIGFPFPAAVLLAIICGALNAVPFLGPMIGGLAIFSYALIAEDIHPLLPFLELSHLPVAALIVAGTVQVLDNVLFAPIVLGRAVNLHPLVVILSLSVASMMFGVLGVVVTIPTVVVIKTIVHSLFSQLKAYRLI
ncbi:AI-2E family transporter [bacterium]|nr:AI-2E family transporter [bacterium]